MQGTKNNDALRTLIDQLQPEQVRITQRLSQSSPLYSKFQAIRNSSGNWSEAETRVLDNLITSAKLAGAALEVILLCFFLCVPVAAQQSSWASEAKQRPCSSTCMGDNSWSAASQVAVPEGRSKEDAQAEATQRFNDINLQLSNLANNFSNNLLDSTAAFKRLITDKAGVAGLPDSFLGQAAQKVWCLPSALGFFYRTGLVPIQAELATSPDHINA